MTNLKMPKVKADENGDLVIIEGQENGWLRKPVNDEHPDHFEHIFVHGAMLVVMYEELDHGEPIWVTLVHPSLENALRAVNYTAYIPDQIDDDAEDTLDTVDDCLAHAVNIEFENRAAEYNQ